MNSLSKQILISIVIAAIVFVTIGYIGSGVITAPSGGGWIVLFAIAIGNFISISLAPGAPANSTGSVRSDAPDDGDTETGTVKWFNVKKGYGFITRDQGEDVFVHYRNIEGEGRRAISEGQRVSFIVVDGDKGLQADNVIGLD